jgi:hypothetical protein
MAPPTLEELTYSVAQRALDQQSTALSDLRTRTSTLDRVEKELSPYREDPAAYLLRAGHGLRDVSRKNRTVIERRELVFSLALIALGIETLMWTLALALT